MTAMVMLAVLLAIVVVGLIILWLAVRKRKSSSRVLPMRKPTPSEHGATHHAIWLPVAQEPGPRPAPPEQCDAASPESTPSTLLRLTEATGCVAHRRSADPDPSASGRGNGCAPARDGPHEPTHAQAPRLPGAGRCPPGRAHPDGLRVVPRSAKGQVRTSGSAQETHLEIVPWTNSRAGTRHRQVQDLSDRVDARVQTAAHPACPTRGSLRVEQEGGDHHRASRRHRSLPTRTRPGLRRRSGRTGRGGRSPPRGPMAETGQGDRTAVVRQVAEGRISGVPVEVDAGFDTGVATVQVSAAFRALRLAIHDPGGPGTR